MEPLAAALAMCVPMTSGPIPSAPVVVDAYVEAYNRHDLKTLRQLISADAEIGYPGALVTGSELMERYETFVFGKFPKVAIKTLNRVAYNDLVAQTEHISDLGPRDAEGLSVYRVDRGCIVSMSISQ